MKSRDILCLKHKIIHEDEDFAALHVWINNPVTSYIILPEKADAGVIAHEAWHVVQQMMCHWAGGKMDNELVAYHLGYITQQAFDFVRKK